MPSYAVYTLKKLGYLGNLRPCVDSVKNVGGLFKEEGRGGAERRQPPRLEATGKEETVKQYIQQITQKKLLAIFSYAQENNFCLSGQGLSHLKRKDL